jgi:hexosaminidase
MFFLTTGGTMHEDLALLPKPQRLQYLEGTLNLKTDRLILLSGTYSRELLYIGQAVQAAITTVKPAEVYWELTTARLDGQHLGAIVRLDPAQVRQPEGYKLSITSDKVLIVANDEAGAFYAAMTLKQIARQASNGELPCLHIEDWPDFAHRGVLLDLSRDKVPTMETLYALIEMLAEWKINQLQLYTEHTFAYRNHRDVWADASPLTGEEILALDDYCRLRHIELVPNQNSFGHLTRWFRHPRYAPLAETQVGFTYPWGERDDEASSLCPQDPGALRLIAELYDELLPHFSSRQFNIGCDEVFELGQPGTRSEQLCQERGRSRVYLDFVLQLYTLAHQHGHTVQFWGDVIVQHPELLHELPDSIVPVIWGYEADHPFDHQSAVLTEAGIPFYVCAGTSSWSSIAGRTQNAMDNLRNSAENGLKHGAIGYLIGDWGDRGHWQTLPISYLGFAYGAALAWATAINRDLDLPRVLSLHAFQDASNVMGHLAYDLGNVYQQTGLLIANSSALFWLLQFPEKSFDSAWITGLTSQNLMQTQAYLERTINQLSQARMARPDEALLADEFRLAAALMDHACRLGIARLEAVDNAMVNIPMKTREQLARELERLIEEYKRVWLSRNRPGGLKDSVGRLEKLFGLYQL